MPLCLRMMPIDKLKPAPYNPRKPLRPGSRAWRKLERSLAEFGLVQPIVWNETTGHVVGGHQRLEILKHQGVTELEVTVVRMPLEREKALNIALNNELVGSRWDDDKLVNLITELQELPDFDATLTGFDDNDMRALIFTPAEAFDEADANTEPVDPRVKVSLLVEPDRWPEFRRELDSLLYRIPFELHVGVSGS